MKHFTVQKQMTLVAVVVAMLTLTATLRAAVPTHLTLLNADVVAITEVVGVEENAFKRDGREYHLATMKIVERLKGDDGIKSVKVAFLKPLEVENSTPRAQRLPGVPVPKEERQAEFEQVVAKSYDVGTTALWVLEKDAKRGCYWAQGHRLPHYELITTEAVEAELKRLASLQWSAPVNGVKFGVVGFCDYGGYAQRKWHDELAPRLYLVAQNVADQSVRLFRLRSSDMLSVAVTDAAGKPRRVDLHPFGRTKTPEKPVHVQIINQKKVVTPRWDWSTVLIEPGQATGLAGTGPLLLGELTQPGTYRIAVTFRSDTDIPADEYPGNPKKESLWKGEVTLPTIEVEVPTEASAESE